MSEKNGKKQTQTLWRQKKGELKKAGGSAKGRKKNKRKAHPGASGTAIGVHTNGWSQKRKIGWCVGGDAGSALPFFRLSLPSCTQKRHFI